MGRIPTVYFCPHENCTASYNHKYKYEVHLRSHSGERPYVCSYEGCGKAYISSSHCKRHEHTHGSSYPCPEKGCFEVLKTKSTLNKHIKTVHLKIKKHKVFPCTECGKDFNKHKTLQMHLLKHTGELPYKCEFEGCKKAFLTPSKLKRHNKVHQGYKCEKPNCDQVFEKWSLLVMHLKDAHRPEYKCDTCGRLFSNSYALKLHCRIHDEIRMAYPCEVPNCVRYYFDKKNLQWHMRKYHAKRPFNCPKKNCYKAFKTEAELDDHLSFHNKKRRPRRQFFLSEKKSKRKSQEATLSEILSGCVDVSTKVDKIFKSKLKQKTNENIDASTSFCDSSTSCNESDSIVLSEQDLTEANHSNSELNTSFISDESKTSESVHLTTAKKSHIYNEK
ncbi:transcription factor IIIA [Caerostris extrusa]|uniref:Transcription factor IIIA n=1 Tax=Caerostris extrusa TaxID=172846 RepID=A0AAV4PP99_CAEEX|nr:transcription factor IIIA [Caerostris extrusa]